MIAVKRKNNKPQRAATAPSPICVGSGFVALDLVLIGNSQQNASFSFAGGSCGNVLTILAFLGWDSVPVIRLKDDEQAAELLADLQKWSVNMRFVTKEPHGTTPVVVQRICTSINGDSYHRFEWKCPTSGVWLPRYRPLPSRMAIEVSTKMPRPRVFYFDRTAKSALILARKSKAAGALVFFEPSGIGDIELFRECVAIADVVKYSEERFAQRLSYGSTKPLLEIQTRGKEGLRYLWRGKPQNGANPWRKLKAIPAVDFKDAAGSGDWCSAGLIHMLGRSGRRGLLQSSERRVVQALRFGQALAAINCRFEGARGAMYRMSDANLQAEAKSLLLERAEGSHRLR
jgi:sugar/nucleoside kinase (ribokinase family)